MANEIQMSVPSLPNLKRRAKDLLRDCALGNPEARALAIAHHPRLRPGHIDGEALSALRHADALLILARSIGFNSWPELVAETGPGVVRFAMDAKDASRRASEHCSNDERFHRWMVDEYCRRNPSSMVGETPEFWHAERIDSWVVWRIRDFQAKSVVEAVVEAVDEALKHCFFPFEAVWLGHRAIDVRSEYRGKRVRFESNDNSHWTMGG